MEAILAQEFEATVRYAHTAALQPGSQRESVSQIKFFKNKIVQSVFSTRIECI